MAPIGGQSNEVLVVSTDMTTGEIRETLLVMSRDSNTHVNTSMTPRVNVVGITLTSRLRDFVRMNPSIFLGSKVGDDSQEFLYVVYNVLSDMGVTSREKAELASYQLREVAQVWYTQWKDNKPVRLGLIKWEKFKKLF